jgi:putative FmdB family regulatory protein
MPTYHYRCPSCAHEFERFHKMTVKSRPKCPQCGSRTERVISGGAGLVFKGSGFYITDYKRAGEAKGGEEKADKSDKPVSSEPGGKGSSAAKTAKPSKSGGAET